MKNYIVLKDFTLYKSYTRGETIALEAKIAKTLINQKYIK